MTKKNNMGRPSKKQRCLEEEADDGPSLNYAIESEDESDTGGLIQSASEALMPISSFSNHFGHKLSEEEVEGLSSKKWKYNWEIPSLCMSNGKWMGTGKGILEDHNMNSSYDLKSNLYKHWLELYETSGGSDFHSSRQRLFFSLCNSYRDVLHVNKRPFYLKGMEEDSCIMDAYIMHSLNHLFKTRTLVKKNDAKLAKHQEMGSEDILGCEGFLDHGFTRPKVLIMLPLASIMLRVIKRLIQLTPSAFKVNVEHLDRLLKDFAKGDDENNEEECKSKKSSKPSDFEKLFGGNNEDHFMVGIKFTRKSIKLFSDFYSSDIIVASPLGLITKIGEAEEDKEKDVDYLSSIEVLVIDHADIIAMQNWSFVSSVLEQVNKIPTKQHGTNVMRIRPWYLDRNAKFYRQSIILGHYTNPGLRVLYG